MTDKSADAIADARRTAEFWKAEYRAANEVIARLEFELAQWEGVAHRNIELQNKLAALEEKHQARIAMLVDALSGLVDGVIPEINEKGAGGYLLARLSDAKQALAATQQDADAFVARARAGILDEAV